jgi:hypothetical protein
MFVNTRLDLSKTTVPFRLALAAPIDIAEENRAGAATFSVRPAALPLSERAIQPVDNDSSIALIIHASY